MRKCYINQAKLIVKVISDKITKRIKTVSVYDNRTNQYWSDEQINERGIQEFLNVEDMKETLNWNLNGDSSKFQFTWGQSSKLNTDGNAYIVG